ncbi:hypothetical protein GURKE_01390 [Brevundimonas phage vB_BpoS-Gurke]|uniref:Uncharacterized protein n=1 Tax=Brevundimonas phage vB_BpoS-Gurke TaxID=2948599 RepID=A0A9E7N334_9CAUD|nr:hypothetical protein GURKE_01390 [Brevundimonas phage vB_BpoS-Gurke]
MSETADWCLLTITQGGKVSLIKGLTAGEAREAARRTVPSWRRPNPGSRDRIMRLQSNENTIDKIEVFRGTGETMDIWDGWEAE